MTDTTVTAAPTKASGAFYVERVTHVEHWTDELFTLRTTRDPALRFASGQFVMLGLMVGEKPLVRAYSVVSPASGRTSSSSSRSRCRTGRLTSRLQHLKVGDEVLVSRKPTGTLVLDGPKPGKNLYMLGTAHWPRALPLPDPRPLETYERYEKVVVTHTVRRTPSTWPTGTSSSTACAEDEDLGELVAPKV